VKLLIQFHLKRQAIKTCSYKAAVPSYLCDQLQIIYVVLFCDNELVDVPLPFPFSRRQHIQKMQVCTPWKTQKDPRFDLR